jgi:hypothetical protein
MTEQPRAEQPEAPAPEEELGQLTRHETAQQLTNRGIASYIPSWKRIGLTAAAMGAAVILGWGGCALTDAINNRARTIYEGNMGRSRVVYRESPRENSLEVKSGKYNFVFKDDDGQSIQEQTFNPTKDKVESVEITKPGERKIIDNYSDGKLYGFDRGKFMEAANTCYNGVRGAIRTKKFEEIEEIVGEFEEIGAENTPKKPIRPLSFISFW